MVICSGPSFHSVFIAAVNINKALLLLLSINDATDIAVRVRIRSVLFVNGDKEMKCENGQIIHRLP